MVPRPHQLAFPLSVSVRSLPQMEASTAQDASARQKEVGAFYTPPAMAAALADWAIQKPSDRVLDPSFGGLAFLGAAADRLCALGAAPAEAGKQLYGVDLDPEALDAAEAASHLRIPGENLTLADFFAVGTASLAPVEALIGNPPYIRFQGFNGSAELARDLMRIADVDLTRLASSWAPFVVHGTAFVAPGGRMAQVLPAELLHAQYADEVLAFLERSFGRVAIAAFEERVFPGALEEVVLLFADNRGASRTDDVTFRSFPTFNDLDLDHLHQDEGTPSVRRVYSGGRKLLAQLISEDTRDLLDQVLVEGHVRELGDLGSVDIGVVTGANDFFIRTNAEAQEIPKSLLRPAVSKARHVAGISLSLADHDALLDQGQRGLMFVADSGSDPSAIADVRAYLERGFKSKVHERYKCRIREPWWALPVPKAGPPHMLLTYCSGEHPRLVVNEVEALNTNTLHGLRLNEPETARLLAVGFMNSLTLLSTELVGRSYGGGVLKLEPTEAERVLIPTLPASLSKVSTQVDALVRARNLDGALDLVDPIVLGEGMNLAATQIALIRANGERLRERRRARGSEPRA